MKAYPDLKTKLAQEIAQQGAISIHDYMNACLYDPEFGYYTRGERIGAGGDFITAPEISQIFGELIGVWVCHIWNGFGCPDGMQLVELGPGRGTLMADALRACRVLPNLIGVLSVELVETSKTLRGRQRSTLNGISNPIRWHDDFTSVPLRPTVLLANEFLDCLPIHQFQRVGGTWCERMLRYDGSRFLPVTGSRPVTLEGVPPDAQDGDIWEHRPGVDLLLAELGRRAELEPLAALVIDYGSVKAGFGDTLQAVRRHRFADPFDHPEEADLTSHVNFAHLRVSAAAARLRAFGPMPMGEWLLRMGAQERLDRLTRDASTPVGDGLRAGIARLIDPSQMGGLFKAVALTSATLPAPPPFNLE